MAKNRNKVSIIAAILQAANSGATKTRIMHTANLSYKLLEKYLDTTMQLGFVIPLGSKYAVTFRGHEFLCKYQLFQARYGKVQELLRDLASERAQLEQQCQENKMVLQK